MKILTEWKVVSDLSSANKYKLIKVVKHSDEDFNNPNFFKSCKLQTVYLKR